MHHTTIFCLYAFQHGRRDHSIAIHEKEPDIAHSPTLFKQSIVTLTATLRTLYTNLTLLIMGDFQHTVSDNTLHRMGQRKPPPPANVLTQCLKHPFNLISVIPTQYPTLAYHTWYSKSGTGRAGIDHTLAALEHIHPNSPCGIDHEITTTLFKSDHYLIFAFFDLQCPNTAPPPPTSTRYHYRRIAEIPLRKTYPMNTNDSTPPWYAPKTIGILPDDVRFHARIHDALAMAHDHPQAQAHLRNMTQHLEALNQLTADLYATYTSTTPPPPPEILIPRTQQARRLINKACTSWKKGIEQLMVTSKLVTVYKPRTNTTGPSKRKVKQSKRT